MKEDSLVAAMAATFKNHSDAVTVVCGRRGECHAMTHPTSSLLLVVVEKKSELTRGAV